MENLILAVGAAVIILFVAVMEALDWAGRYEYMQTHFPRIVKWADKRQGRLLLLIVAVAMQGRVLWEAHSVKEPSNSLRRRTMQLADEMEKYFVARENDPKRPPVAIPDSSNPNPSDEQKAAIERYRAYQQETWNYYFTHYKDRTVGIIKEYQAKGVKTAYLESAASQRPLAPAMAGSVVEGTCMDELYQFRELAYHVDGEGNLVVVAP